MSAAIRTGDPAAAVDACPGWSLADLVRHTGQVHRWARVAVENGRAPERGEVEPPGDDENLAVWIVDGAQRLADSLEATDPAGATWHPFPVVQQNWVWARRQAIETMIHRWDAESAAGLDALIDPTLASEGIHEFVEMAYPRIIIREDVRPPDASLHLHCTDVDGEWLIWTDDGQYRMLPVHEKGDAAMRGPAADLLLAITGRIDRSRIDIVGDESAAAAWLDLPGL